MRLVVALNKALPVPHVYPAITFEPDLTEMLDFHEAEPFVQRYALRVRQSDTRYGGMVAASWQLSKRAL